MIHVWPDARGPSQIAEFLRSLATNETKQRSKTAQSTGSALGHHKGGTILGWTIHE